LRVRRMHKPGPGVTGIAGDPIGNVSLVQEPQRWKALRGKDPRGVRGAVAGTDQPRHYNTMNRRIRRRPSVPVEVDRVEEVLLLQMRCQGNEHAGRTERVVELDTQGIRVPDVHIMAGGQANLFEIVGTPGPPG